MSGDIFGVESLTLTFKDHNKDPELAQVSVISQYMQRAFNVSFANGTLLSGTLTFQELTFF